MSAIVPGFEYDVFISYRHNDNRSGWVTVFVNALQEELAATIKEPLSIYFDKNLHDGLLETHNVDKSLEGKLKCLIFIPIISQTYCDTKSFAWQHEFCAFNKRSTEDHFGRDIKLSNGNVASRILPIKIHDLDATDKATIESELGGALRAVDFIYREPGVNRPLKPTDSKADNQNKTDYRNQVNKVANAVKELITAIRQPHAAQPLAGNHQSPIPAKKSNTKFIVAAALLLMAIIAGYFFYSKLSGNQQPLDKSIAVLPFTDMSPNHDYEYFGDGLSDEVINTLSSLPGLKVIARSSSFQFKGGDQDVVRLGKLLNVATVLQGSVRPSGSRVRISAQLVNTANGQLIWSKSFDHTPKDILLVQEEVSRSVAELLKVTFSIGRISRPWDEQAWKLYQEGRFFWDRTGIDDRRKASKLFEQALHYDSTQPILYAFLAASVDDVKNPKARAYLDKALELDSISPETNITFSRIERMGLRFVNALRITERALKNGRGSNLVLRVAARTYVLFGKKEYAIELAQQAVELDPLAAYSHAQLAFVYYNAQKYDSAIHTYRKVIELSPNFASGHDMISKCLLLTGRVEEALEEIELEFDEQQKLETRCLIAYARGKQSESNQLLKAYLLKYGEQSPWIVAYLYAYRNEPEKAIQWLEKSLAAKDSFLEGTLVEPFFDKIRHTPSFQQILRELDFPDPNEQRP